MMGDGEHAMSKKIGKPFGRSKRDIPLIQEVSPKVNLHNHAHHNTVRKLDLNGHLKISALELDEALNHAGTTPENLWKRQQMSGMDGKDGDFSDSVSSAMVDADGIPTMLKNKR